MTTQPRKEGPIRVMVVDDSILLRTVVQETLQKAGFTVLTAADGIEAWERLQKEAVDVVVADVTMPQLDGLQLTRMIRADRQLWRLPVVLMSAIDTKEERQRVLLTGASDFILKARQDLESLPEKIIELLAFT